MLDTEVFSKCVKTSSICVRLVSVLFPYIVVSYIIYTIYIVLLLLLLSYRPLTQRNATWMLRSQTKNTSVSESP